MRIRRKLWQLEDSRWAASPESIIHKKVGIEPTIYSDLWYSYRDLEQDYDAHENVNHQNEFVRGAALINGIEGFLGLGKERLLSTMGSPQALSPLPQRDGVPP